eukprot:6183803-Pleurochrysis_carterae.AAC.2
MDEAYVGGDVHIQQVRNGVLAFHIPALRVAGEGIVEAPVAVVRVQCEQIVDVATEDNTLRDAANVPLDGI